MNLSCKDTKSFRTWTLGNTVICMWNRYSNTARFFYRPGSIPQSVKAINNVFERLGINKTLILSQKKMLFLESYYDVDIKYTYFKQGMVIKC